LDEQSVQLLIRQFVELLDWQSNCVNVFDSGQTIDQTVEITSQPMSQKQANDASGRRRAMRRSVWNARASNEG